MSRRYFLNFFLHARSRSRDAPAVSIIVTLRSLVFGVLLTLLLLDDLLEEALAVVLVADAFTAPVVVPVPLLEMLLVVSVPEAVVSVVVTSVLLEGVCTPLFSVVLCGVVVVSVVVVVVVVIVVVTVVDVVGSVPVPRYASIMIT